jgi:hypothetical protein
MRSELLGALRLLDSPLLPRPLRPLRSRGSLQKPVAKPAWFRNGFSHAKLGLSTAPIPWPQNRTDTVGEFTSGTDSAPAVGQEAAPDHSDSAPGQQLGPIRQQYPNVFATVLPLMTELLGLPRFPVQAAPMLGAALDELNGRAKADAIGGD